MLLGLPILLWSLDKGDWGDKGFLVLVIFFTPFMLIYFFFPKIHKLARNIYLTFTLAFIILLCIIFIKTMFQEAKQNQTLSSPKFVNSPSSVFKLGWTLYTNKTYAYSLMFPATYQVLPQTEKEISQLGIDKNIAIKRKSDPSGSSVIMIDVNLNNEGLSLKDYMNKNLKMFGITGPLVSYNFNGYDSLLNKNQPGINVFVKNGNNINSSHIYHITAPTASSDKEIGDILATFKFTQ